MLHSVSSLLARLEICNVFCQGAPARISGPGRFFADAVNLGFMSL
jgi:hypothetical protein